MRHERGAGGVGVADSDQAELGTAPEDQVFGQARDVQSQEGAGCAEFDCEVAVAHGVHRILGYDWPALLVEEAKEPRDHFAVESQRGTGNRAAAEGTDVDTTKSIDEPLLVALQHLDVCEEMMGEIDRLRPLQMCVAGHDDINITGGQIDESPLELLDFAAQAGDFVTEPESHVEGDLIIARAGGVELCAGRCAASELGFDVHVNILKL